jgi:hypothetical protein
MTASDSSAVLVPSPACTPYTVISIRD